jgi:hypothetical protein
MCKSTYCVLSLRRTAKSVCCFMHRNAKACMLLRLRISQHACFCIPMRTSSYSFRCLLERLHVCCCIALQDLNYLKKHNRRFNNSVIVYIRNKLVIAYSSKKQTMSLWFLNALVIVYSSVKQVMLSLWCTTENVSLQRIHLYQACNAIQHHICHVLLLQCTRE